MSVIVIMPLKTQILKHLGKVVEIKWRDPKLSHAEVHDITHVPNGWEELAIQRDWGVLASLKEGVVQIIHCAGRTELKEVDTAFAYSLIPVSLIEKITVFGRVK